MPRIDHLKQYQYKPGQSGNPKGKPRGRTSFEELVQKELTKKIKVGEKRISKREILARIVVDEMLNHRNMRVIELVINRLWPVPNKLEIAGQIEAGATPQQELSEEERADRILRVAELMRDLERGGKLPVPAIEAESQRVDD